MNTKKLVQAAATALAVSLMGAGAQAQYGYTEVAANRDVAMSVSVGSIRREALDSTVVLFDIRLSSKAVFNLPKTNSGVSWAAIDARGIADCASQDQWLETETYWRGRGGELVEQAVRGKDNALRVAAAPGSLIASAIAYACKNLPAAPRPVVAAAATAVGGPVVTRSTAQPSAKTSVSSGTAFAVDRSGHLLTNNHVVSDCSSVTLISVDGFSSPARVQARDTRNDLALLTTTARSVGFALFRRDGIKSGENVVALGYPYRGLLATDVNVSVGIVSAMAGLLNDTSTLQISAPVQPGNSGGPLLDSWGAVSGVVVAKLDALKFAKLNGDIPQNINFAIKSEVAQLFLRSNGIEPTFIGQKPTSASTADHVQTARQYTWLVECVTESQDR